MRKLLILGLMMSTLLLSGCTLEDEEKEPTTSVSTSALRFDGIDDWVSITDFNVFEFGLSDFSIELWLKIAKRDQNQRLFGKALNGHVDGEARWWIMVDSTNVLHVLIEDSENTGDPLIVRGTTDIADDQWHHIAAVFDRDSVLSLFMDGELEVENAGLTEHNGSLSNQANVNLYLGCTAGPSQFFCGEVTDLRIWSIALDQATIVERMHHLIGGIETGLVANYKMSEGSGQLMLDYKGGRDGLLGSGPESDVNDPLWIRIIHP